MADESGMRRIAERMRAIPAAVEAEVKKALQASAEAIVKQAKSLVPVDSGALRDSIGWTFGDAPNGAQVLAASASVGGITVTIYAGSDQAYYARWVEFGTKAGVFGARAPNGATGKRGRSLLGRKIRRTHPGTPAQPFFFTAYQLEKKRAKSRIKRAINKAARAHWGNRS